MLTSANDEPMAITSLLRFLVFFSSFCLFRSPSFLSKSLAKCRLPHNFALSFSLFIVTFGVNEFLRVRVFVVGLIRQEYANPRYAEQDGPFRGDD